MPVEFWMEVLDLLLSITVMLGLGMLVLNGRQIIEALVDWAEEVRNRKRRRR